ncbi:Uncharacterized protein ycf19 [Morus notabilis]|uniref:Uncharacterized protein ycf19 n=1 Tax=Morus notabilis TaxID=981085 RepID=W9RVQ9_9ROSA|nr:ylmG homolog protein 2, chloroplastic [Morus notabilis]EXB74895.1 Uncharacterized protein ycf19 [Morus notabilis]
MAPSESSSSDNSNHTASNFVTNCGLLLSSAKFDPFLRSPLSSKKPNFGPPNILLIGDHLQSSIASAATKCLRFFHSFASQNPLLQKALSLPHEFHSFCHQIRCRSYRNVNSISSHNFAAVLPGDSVAGLVVANGIINFLNIYNTVLIVRLVLTWFPNVPPFIVSPLSTICDPYLNIFRGIIPPLGGTLDLSPILAFLVLNAFTSTAAALPAELPAAESNQQTCSSSFSDLTSSEKKWMRRLHGGNGTKS